MFNFTPIIADSVPLIAATIVVVFAVGIVLESFRRPRLVRRDRLPRLVPRPVRHADEADEARACEWLRSESGQCPPSPTPNSD